jgi:hypothetical protein
MENKINFIIERIQKRGFAQMPGYNRFGFVSRTENSLTVSREKGEQTKIPFTTIEKALKAIKTNYSVYNDGPNALRKYGITHINSPVWALIHLLTLEEIKS